MSSRDPLESTENGSEISFDLNSEAGNSDAEFAQQLSTVLSNSGISSPDWPASLGRYQVRQQFDRGSYGTVLRAWDPTLQREVAIKIARPDRINRVAASSFLTEARTQARLSHPNIAQVYDCGEISNGAVFVVSKFYPGGTLTKLISSSGPRDYIKLAAIMAQVADALEYAHLARVIHRDIKPANILLDEDGLPIVTDFGLAIFMNDRTNAGGTIGSPAYMSPEQARGESHRVNQCADIYSLGVVLFELGCGRRPYTAGSIQELLQAIRTQEIPGLREFAPEAPEELERICTHALQKLPSDRFQSARDFATELRAFAGHAASNEEMRRQSIPNEPDAINRIRPRGLRPFDRSDASFFLDLLPGIKDKEGIPESIRFWKQRIEPTTEYEPFRVGMLWGPSGSGKSSLVRAGLIPHLDAAVLTTVTNARASHLEARILMDINSHVTTSSESLATTLAEIRNGAWLPEGNKLLCVIDQFEQFLHRSEDLSRTELADALRQCDGKRVQALLIVRDDFVLAANQFMEMLEEPLSQDTNWAVLDLFSAKHARKVLIAYGRALGALPVASLGREQSRFVDAAIEGLSEDGKIVPVRLALLAEMMKEQRWVPATLIKYGGMGGLAEAFLAERLEGAGAHPMAKAHPQATRELLKLLLPDEESRIRRPAVPKSELLDRLASLLSPASIEKLLEVLDSDLKLITTGTAKLDRSTESATLHTSSDSVVSIDRERSELHYQLSHDYLVPSLNRWLHRGEMKSIAGRARYRLRELAKFYRLSPEKRLVPNTFEYLWLRWMTKSQNWEPAERELMQLGRAKFIRQVGASCLIATTLGGLGYFIERERSAEQIISTLSTCQTRELLTIMKKARSRSDVREAIAARPTLVANPLHRSLLLETDAETITGLDSPTAEDIATIAKVLQPRSQQFIPLLVADITQRLDAYASVSGRDVARFQHQLLTRLALLSQLSPQQAEWSQWYAPTLQAVVASPTLVRSDWLQALEPLRDDLAKSALQTIALEVGLEDSADRHAWIEVTSQLCADQPDRLVQLALWCDGDELVRYILPAIEQNAQAISKASVDWFNLLDVDRVTPFKTPPNISADEWTRLSDEVQQASGILTDVGGYAVGLSRLQLEELSNQLQPAGLMPSSIIITRLDGQPWEILLAQGEKLPDDSQLSFTCTWAPAVKRHPEVMLQAITPIAPSIPTASAVVTDLLQTGKLAWYAVEQEQTELDSISQRDSLAAFGDRRPDHLLSKLRIWVRWDRDYAQALDLKRRYEARLIDDREVENRSNTLVRIASELWRLGQYEECLRRLDEADSLFIDKLSSSVRIKALCALGRLDEARAIYLERDSNDASDEVRVLAPGELKIELAKRLDDIDSQLAADVPQTTWFETAKSAGVAASRLQDVDIELAQRAIEATFHSIERMCQKPGFASFIRIWHEPDFDRVRQYVPFQKWARENQCDVTVSGEWVQDDRSEDVQLLTANKSEHDGQLKAYLALGYHLVSTDHCRVGEDTSYFASLLHRPIDRNVRDQQLRQRAIMSVLAAHLGDFGPLMSTLGVAGTAQAEAIEAMAASQLNPADLLRRLEGTDDHQLQYSLLLSLGSIPSAQLGIENVDRLMLVANRLASTQHAGVASAVTWCSKQHGRDASVAFIGQANKQQRGSQISAFRTASDGTVMVRVVPPEQIVVGSPFYENGVEDAELRHVATGLRPFEIGSTEVTVAQFDKFIAYAKERFPQAPGFLFVSGDSSPEPNCPQLSIRMLDAMRYCQWLSEQEGYEESECCYEGIWEADMEELGKYQLPEDFLQRPGFRLPTEEEWEWSARAGLETARPFGDSDRLLSRYAHSGKVGDIAHSIPVASLKPNGFGLFDMFGNGEEWCQNERTTWLLPMYGFMRSMDEMDGIGAQPFRTDRRAPDRPVQELVQHMLRGGSYGDSPDAVRAARRKAKSPEDKSRFTGFRIVRTLE